MARKKDNQVIMARNLIIGFVCVIAILILGFGTYLSTGLEASGEAVAGDDYVLLEDPQPTRPGRPIEVVEFFSYRCPACDTFEPMLTDWIAELPDGVEFKRQHVIFSPIDELYAKTFLVLASLDDFESNHSRVFTAYHDQRVQFLTPEQAADYFDDRGVPKAEFVRLLNSPAVKRNAQRSESEQRQFGIGSTPSLIVAGKYRVSMRGGQRRALTVARQLIDQELGVAGPATD